MALRISVLSKEYIRVPVEATVAGAPYDPTADVVSFAFTQAGDPTSWTTGTWETDTTTSPSTYLARVLVGPGGLVVAAGRWNLWMKITDTPEIPVIPCGIVEFV